MITKISTKAFLLSRSQKILLVLYKLSGGKKKMIRFEDIAVSAFKNFKEDFQLKGYPQHPDSGDIIHKPLYSDLKKRGYVLSGNKYFSLTDKGIEYAKWLTEKIGKISSPAARMVKSDGVKLTATQKKELERINKSTALNMFSKGKKNNILDIDFYSYLGITVRTSKYDFLGRLNIVEDAIESIKIKSPKLYRNLSDCHNFLLKKFKSNTDYFKKNRRGEK